MRIKRYSILCYLLFILCHIAVAQQQPVQLASVLQDSMVIQQNKPFKVWGRARAGSMVAVTGSWNNRTIAVKADSNDQFMAILEVPAVKPGDFSSYQLTVSSAGASVVLHHLLIGEVWICSGQSNMQFSMKEELNREQEIPLSALPNVRLFNTGLNFSNEPIDTVSGRWKGCSPQTVKDFSAVAYYFGKELFEKLQVPVGIIFTGIGASGAQAYVPRSVLAADPLLDSVYLQPYLQSPKSKEEINAGFSFEKVMRPYLLYNAMIHPFRHLSVRGFCWYQGEANHMERASYTHLTQTLIKSWRAQFAQGELPFYYVQIAPYFHEKENPDLAFDAFFREAQEKVDALNNTAMVLTMDVGEAKDLHPKNKKPIGHRLACTALNRTYGWLQVDYKGPAFQYVTFEKAKAVVHFDPESLAGGLKTNNGQPPAFFMLAGSDQQFYPASATISGETVVLHAAKVKHPVAVRYAFFNYPVTNLENGKGFPALPFRTDHWEEKTE